MQEVYGLLCNEPWKWPPAVVSKLTDWQVSELVFGPAARRGKGKKRKTRLPNREEYVRVGVATFGGDPEALGREYDRVMSERNGDPDHTPD